jgi:hypothetical protein
MEVKKTPFNQALAPGEIKSVAVKAYRLRLCGQAKSSETSSSA